MSEHAAHLQQAAAARVSANAIRANTGDNRNGDPGASRAFGSTQASSEGLTLAVDDF